MARFVIEYLAIRRDRAQVSKFLSRESIPGMIAGAALRVLRRVVHRRDRAAIEELTHPPRGFSQPTLPDLSQIRLVAFDFDGVMTDDAVWVREDGVELVRAHRGDGLGLQRLAASGMQLVVISKEQNPVVRARCAKLGITCHHGVDDKLSLLRHFVSERGLGQHQVAFVGNDINDVACMEWVSLGIAVANATDEALAAASWHTTRSGGYGAVREICDAFIRAAEER